MHSKEGCNCPTHTDERMLEACFGRGRTVGEMSPEQVERICDVFDRNYRRSMRQICMDILQENIERLIEFIDAHIALIDYIFDLYGVLY